MTTFLTTCFIGLIVMILGIINMTGNISSLHWYHRQRVREEDRKMFGRLVGLGTLIIGIVICVFGATFLAFEKSGNELYTVAGTAVLIAGLGVGIALSFYAMIKYNKGIF